jgi:hypothetical protein
MVEVHRARRIALAAIGTRHGSTSIQDRRLSTPVRPLPIQVARRPRGGRWSRLMALPRPDPVAVRAHHIAFGCFMEDDGRRREQRASGSQPERFHRVIPMVEIHLMRLE